MTYEERVAVRQARDRAARDRAWKDRKRGCDPGLTPIALKAADGDPWEALHLAITYVPPMVIVDYRRPNGQHYAHTVPGNRKARLENWPT